MHFSSKLERFLIVKYHNWKVSESESARIGKCLQWKVSELEYTNLHLSFFAEKSRMHFCAKRENVLI